MFQSVTAAAVPSCIQPFQSFTSFSPIELFYIFCISLRDKIVVCTVCVPPLFVIDYHDQYYSLSLLLLLAVLMVT